jgi:hypothetical protein
LSLQEKAWDSYKFKRSEHIEMQIELSQHQERSRKISCGCSNEAPDVQHYFSPDKLRARLEEHLANTTRKPRRPVDE